ncbi:hypothetical protein SODALDRAFT_100755 [Sodiomyces alkalinus F11]|uniref:Uncharacterized protein n=1 Tax=Sodiomyces alkalinus (strain CBS 110278 / VKM F-3762 / F11) TaxID=1314773 RepID=A0A3N2Q1W8_SODAK|nr:hypothetical protein SODALDRAFT_100755 [Sodiomyces alkalinus F11]ROT40615.1 hypothetical protein SODALDRAFT_100755 [Sodiomyces alkalinus F11]
MRGPPCQVVRPYPTLFCTLLNTFLATLGYRLHIPHMHAWETQSLSGFMASCIPSYLSACGTSAGPDNAPNWQEAKFSTGLVTADIDGTSYSYHRQPSRIWAPTFPRQLSRSLSENFIQPIHTAPFLRPTILAA